MPLGVAFQKYRCAHGAILLNEKCPREGVSFFVMDAIRPDSFAVGVRQQRKSDVRAFGKTTEHLDRIVAETNNLNAGRFDLL